MIKIIINTDNSAFDNKNYEIARILRELSENIETGNYNISRNLRDLNGNNIGKIEDTEE